MYNDNFEELDDLLHEALVVSGVSFSSAIPLYLQALNMAEKNNDHIKIFYIKLELVRAYNFTGETKKFLAEMLWLFNNVTDEILQVNVIYNSLKRKFLFEIKYIENFYRFSSIPLRKLIEMHEHVKQIYLNCNEGLRPFYSTQLKSIINGVPLANPDECYNNWILATQTQYDDCRACEKNLEIEYLIYKSDYETALLKMEKLLKSRQSCHEVPNITYSNMLIPLVKMGKIELADSYHKKSYKKILKDKEYIKEISFHILYMCFRDYEKAIAMFKDNIEIFQMVQDDFSNLHYQVCAFALFQTLEKHGKSDICIKFDKSFEIYNSSDSYSVKILKDYYKDKMDSLKNDFDKRNGNNEVSRLIEDKLNSCIK